MLSLPHMLIWQLLFLLCTECFWAVRSVFWKPYFDHNYNFMCKLGQSSAIGEKRVVGSHLTAAYFFLLACDYQWCRKMFDFGWDNSMLTVNNIQILAYSFLSHHLFIWLDLIVKVEPLALRALEVLMSLLDDVFTGITHW